MFCVMVASDRVFDAVGGLVVRPTYNVVSWNPRKSVITTVSRPLLLDYAFVDMDLWSEVLDVTRRWGQRARRLMFEGEPVGLPASDVASIGERAREGEWDIDRTRRPRPSMLQKMQVVGVGGSVSIDLAGVPVTGVVASSDSTRVVVDVSGTSIRVVVR